MWREWSAHLGVDDPDGMAQFIQAGNLIFRAPGYDGAVILALWDEIGIPYEIFDPEALRARWPDLDVGQYWPPKTIDDPAFAEPAAAELSAFYNGDSGYIDDPMLSAHNLAHAARHHGADFRFRRAVTAIERAGGRVSGVDLDGGETLRAPVVVNVAGPHSHARQRAGRGHRRHAHRSPPAAPGGLRRARPSGFRLDDGGPVVADLDIGQYFRPQAGGTLLVGGTEPECDELEWVDDPDVFGEVPTVERWETAMFRLARRLPTFGVPSRPVGLAALYDASDDWVPIYDRSSLAGFFMACGTSGNQFKNAPLAGQFIRALVDAADAGVDHDVEPVQFPGPTTGQTIDLASFSRLRDPSITSGTVMG